jgi:hypothetical protein
MSTFYRQAALMTAHCLQAPLANSAGISETSGFHTLRQRLPKSHRSNGSNGIHLVEQGRYTREMTTAILKNGQGVPLTHEQGRRVLYALTTLAVTPLGAQINIRRLADDGTELWPCRPS